MNITSCFFSRCAIYIYWTNRGSLEVTLQARDPTEDGQFCYEQAVLISDVLSDNNAIKSPATQYMLTASSASALRQVNPIPPVDQGDAGDATTQPSGAAAVSLSILCTAIALLGLLFA